MIVSALVVVCYQRRLANLLFGVPEDEEGNEVYMDHLPWYHSIILTVSSLGDSEAEMLSSFLLSTQNHLEFLIYLFSKH